MLAKNNKKICSTCKKELSIKDFYKNNAQRDGLSNVCRKCDKEYSRKDYLKHSELRNKKTRRNRIKNKWKYEIEYNRNLKKTKKGRIQLKARDVLRKAIDKGKIRKRNSCEFCYSNKNIQGHHEDYSKPLDVIWMCAKCHKLLHKQYNEKKITLI